MKVTNLFLLVLISITIKYIACIFHNIAITLPLTFIVDNVTITENFILQYKDLYKWENIVHEFSSNYNLDYDALITHVHEKIIHLKYDINPTIASGNDILPATSLASSLYYLLKPTNQIFNNRDNINSSNNDNCSIDSLSLPVYDLFAGNIPYHKTSLFKKENLILSFRQLFKSQPSVYNNNTSSFSSSPSHTELNRDNDDELPLYIHYFQQFFIPKQLRHDTDNTPSSIPTTITTLQLPRIMIYQASIGRTGGTIALDILQETTKNLGYPVIYCDLLQPRDVMRPECRSPRGTKC